MSEGRFAALPYRLNVGAALFNRAGQIWVGQRADLPPELGHAWQMPQGGIDKGEDPRAAVLRELAEEIGTAHAQIIGEHPDWLEYDLPERLLGVAWGGKYRGQRQRWFALRFLGEDGDINIFADPHPEFVAWRWADLSELPQLAVEFKRPVYAILAQDFQRYAIPG